MRFRVSFETLTAQCVKTSQQLYCVCSGDLRNISLPDKVRIIDGLVNVRMSSPQFKPFPDSWDWDSIVGVSYIVVEVETISELILFRACHCSLSVHLCHVPPPNILPLRPLVLYQEQDSLRSEQCSH